MGFKQTALRKKRGQRKGNHTRRGKLPRCKVSGKGTFQERQTDVPPSESGYWRCDETINIDRFTGPLAVASCAPVHLPNHLLAFPKSGLADPAGVTLSVHHDAEGAVLTGRADG